MPHRARERKKVGVRTHGRKGRLRMEKSAHQRRLRLTLVTAVDLVERHDAAIFAALGCEDTLALAVVNPLTGEPYTATQLRLHACRAGLGSGEGPPDRGYGVC